MSLKSILRIAQEYLRNYPVISSVQILKGMLKLTYTYSAPASNSKSKKQIFYPFQDIKAGQMLQSGTNILNFDQKTNKLEFNNKFDSILTQEFHDKVIQDAIFGSAKLNKNKDKWIYTAKKKNPKIKSYFVGGSGKLDYAADLGQLCDDVVEVGVYIWDLKLKKIIPIDIKIEGDQSKYVFAYPIFANDQGTKFICHGYRKTQFGYGISFCFNRPVDVFQISIQNIGEENSKINSKKLIKKHETNIFANISPCYNYILYFGGKDYTHAYYLDLVILKRVGQSQNTQQKQQQTKNNPNTNTNNIVQGYDKEWKQIHRIKQAFVGSYYTIKSQTFILDGQSYAYYQTNEKAEQRIKCINLQTGQIKDISQNKIGECYAVMNFDRQQGIVAGNRTSHNSTSFFYMKNTDNKIIHIPPISQAQFKIQQLKDPIHAYYLQSDNIQQEYKKQKRPMLVLIHGGPHAHGDPCLTLLKYILLKCGYVILIPNYSGSTGFGQQYVKAAIGNIGTKDAQQIIKLIQNVLDSKSYIDRQRVYVYGGSYGGYMSAIMGSRYYKYFKSAIILNGVLSVPANFWFSDIPQWSTAQTLNQSKIHGLTADDYVRMFQQSPISQPMKIPTLQFLGAKDRRVPYRQGLLFDAMTRKIGTPIQTFVYQNAAHSLADTVQTSIDVVIKSMLFLEGIPIKEIKQQKNNKNQQKQKQKQTDKEKEKRESYRKTKNITQIISCNIR